MSGNCRQSTFVYAIRIPAINTHCQNKNRNAIYEIWLLEIFYDKDG